MVIDGELSTVIRWLFTILIKHSPTISPDPVFSAAQELSEHQRSGRFRLGHARLGIQPLGAGVK